jgi:hypothetical protein
MSRHILPLLAAVSLFASGVTAPSLADDDATKPAASALLGHNIFFALKEPTLENKAALIDACKKRLSQHPGIVFFAVGVRDENISGAFNDRDYDVALHMIFTGRDALKNYARTADHQKFIVESTPLLKGVRIFDSTVEQVQNESPADK